jgi:hypothetical protein
MTTRRKPTLFSPHERLEKMLKEGQSVSVNPAPFGIAIAHALQFIATHENAHWGNPHDKEPLVIIGSVTSTEGYMILALQGHPLFYLDPTYEVAENNSLVISILREEIDGFELMFLEFLARNYTSILCILAQAAGEMTIRALLQKPLEVFLQTDEYRSCAGSISNLSLATDSPKTDEHT